MRRSASLVDAFRSVTTSVFGRVLVYFLVCSLTMGLCYTIHFNGRTEFLTGLAMSLLVFPVVAMSSLIHWGFLVYPLVVFGGFFYANFNVSNWWLCCPVLLIGLDLGLFQFPV